MDVMNQIVLGLAQWKIGGGRRRLRHKRFATIPQSVKGLESADTWRHTLTFPNPRRLE